MQDNKVYDQAQHLAFLRHIIKNGALLDLLNIDMTRGVISRLCLVKDHPWSKARVVQIEDKIPDNLSCEPELLQFVLENPQYFREDYFYQSMEWMLRRLLAHKDSFLQDSLQQRVLDLLELVKIYYFRGFFEWLQALDRSGVNAETLTADCRQYQSLLALFYTLEDFLVEREVGSFDQHDSDRYACWRQLDVILSLTDNVADNLSALKELSKPTYISCIEPFDALRQARMNASLFLQDQSQHDAEYRFFKLSATRIESEKSPSPTHLFMQRS